MTCLKTILAKMTLNKPFINSYLASRISVEAKYYFLIHFINFRNKRPNKNPKWQKKKKKKFYIFYKKNFQKKTIIVKKKKKRIFGFLPSLNKPFIKSYFASSIGVEVK